MTELLFGAAAAAEGIVLVGLVAGALRERSAFRELERDAQARGGETTPASPGAPPPSVRLLRARARLGPAYAPAVAALEEAIAGARSFDEALTDAVERAATGPSQRSSLPGLLVVMLVLGAAATPLTWALAEAAGRVDLLAHATQQLSGPRLYAAGLAQLPEAFAPLRAGFERSALLSVGAALLFAVRWALRRGDLREGAAIEAVLRAGAAGRPGQPAPNAARLAAVLVPAPSLWPAFRAAIGFLLMTTAAWSLLTLTADLRLANTGPLTFTWPQAPSGVAPAVVLPTFPAGRPLETAERPTAVIGLDTVHVASLRLAGLDRGHLLEGWQAQAPSLRKRFEELRSGSAPLDMLVLAHRQAPMGTVHAVLDYLRAQYKVEHFVLVVRRELPGRPADAPPVHAGSGLRLGESAAMESPTLHARLGLADVVLESAGRTDSSSVSLALPDWAARVRSKAHALAGLRGPEHAVSGSDAAPRIALSTSPDVSYDGFLALVSAIDSACEGPADCSLPSLGLELVLVP